MRSKLVSTALGLALLAAPALTACNEVATNDSIPAPEPLKIAPPKETYPKGPFGVVKGSTVANYGFQGFINAQVQRDTLDAIAFADFYNPHADDASYQPASPEEDDRLYPKGSPYGEGTPRPRALLVDVAAVWCGPCNEEAKTTLPVLHAKYKPCGGEFFLELGDGSEMGTPATQKNLASWGKKYKSDFPITIDPSGQLAALFDPSAYPANMIIDTRTMTVVEVVEGVPSEAFWAKFESVMNNPDCLAKK